MFDRIAASIQKFGNFSPDHLFLILQRLHPLQIKRNKFLIEENQICQSFYFINSGALRHYKVENGRKETTLNLFMKNDWAFEYKSFMTQQPSENFIQAVSDSELFGLTMLDFHELIKLSQTFFWPGTIFEQAANNQDCQRIRLPQKKRYEYLLATKPDVLQFFRLKYIASYLDVTPETLSRIRNKVKPPYN